MYKVEDWDIMDVGVICTEEEEMKNIIEIFGNMSDDLKGAIITAVLTSIISIIGFILTNKNMSKNLKNELKKLFHNCRKSVYNV